VLLRMFLLVVLIMLLLQILQLYKLSEHARWREHLLLELSGPSMALLPMRLLGVLAADVAGLIFRVFFALRGARNTAFQVTYDLIVSVSCHFRDIFAHADVFVVITRGLTIIEELVIFSVDVH
jgi:hypothetical protein